VRQRAVERPRHLGEIERIDEQLCVPDLSATATAHEASKLLLGGATSPRGLLLQCAKRSELTFSVNDLFHRRGTKSADQLVLEVCRTYEEAQPLHGDTSEPAAEAGPLETAPEVALLSGVADTGPPHVQPRRAEQVQELSDGLRASDCHNGDLLGMKVATTALSQRLQRALVAQPLNQDDRTRATADAAIFRVWSLLVVHAPTPDARPERRQPPQLSALCTSALIVASSAALSSFSAKALGHMAPSSRFALSLKPSVAYLVLNL
jgi:hypothetical protein